MARSKRSIREARATFSAKEASAWVKALRKANKGSTVTRRRETFSFGVVYVVLIVK